MAGLGPSIGPAAGDPGPTAQASAVSGEEGGSQAASGNWYDLRICRWPWHVQLGVFPFGSFSYLPKPYEPRPTRTAPSQPGGGAVTGDLSPGAAFLAMKRQALLDSPGESLDGET